MPGKCVYSSDWERQFKWVRAVKNNRQRAFCTTCLKEVDIGNMGVGALTSHRRSAKHLKFQREVDQQDLSSFIKNDIKVELTVPPPPSSSTVSAVESEMRSTPPGVITTTPFSFRGNETLSAEILWTVHTVTMHNSYKSNENVNKLFQTMFKLNKF